ncbi:hypothetical protein [Methylomonas sp. ZR1]|uniref:DUF6985 domain-containing protein n=1 Tax=unclassified Methylomonas TaxID=2608980 RepID=UPI001490A82E|nr:hypothetical protein [Methylomonas sp. ZR1]NOV32197.1 hypothetical protein [Methylomonas sp. ZR1]
MLEINQIRVDDDVLSSVINETFLSDSKKIDIFIEAERFDNIDAEVSRFLDAVNYFISHKEGIEKLVIDKAFEYYCDNILTKKSLYEQVFEITIDPLSLAEEVGRLIRLVKIYIDLEADCPSNIGLSFDCYWDPEHGLGIKLRNLNECEIGGILLFYKEL